MHLSSAPPTKSAPPSLSCAGLLLDLEQRRARAAGADIGLSPLEFAVLHLLITRRYVPMSKAAIAAALPIPVDPRMVDVSIARSRTKLAAAGLDDLIKSVWGRGYMIGDSEGGEPAGPPTTCDLDATLIPA